MGTTMRNIDRQLREPVYKQIYSILCGEVESGVYDKQDKLPSEKELVERFGVERNTVRKALQILVDDGLIVRVPGYGTTLAGRTHNKDRDQPGARGKSILLVTQEDYFRSADTEHFHFKLMQILEKQFSDFGYNLMFKSAGRNLGDTIWQSACAAVTFDSYNQTQAYMDALNLKVPCVSVNHYTPLMTSVISNNFDSAYQVAQMLTEAGHRKIAYVTGKPNYQTTAERLSGIRQLYYQKNLTLEDRWLYTGNWRFQSGFEAGEHFFGAGSAQWPTAVFAFNDDMAFGLMSYFEKHGIRVPEDVSIVGFDKSDKYQAIFRPITTVDVSIEAMAKYACWYLMALIDGKVPDTKAKIQIDAFIENNGTVGPPLQGNPGI